MPVGAPGEQTGAMDDLSQALRDTNWHQIEEALPRGFRERAVEQRLIRRNLPPQLGAKVTEIGVVLRLILFKVATNAALTTVVASFAAAKVIELSAVSLHNWMVKIGCYLGELVKELVASQAYDLQKRHWAGFELVLLDATCVQRPGATSTTARVHRALRIPDLRIVEFVLTDEHGGETFRNFTTPRSGQLWIADRGYANPPGIAWMVAHGAAVLVRHNRGSLPLYDAKGRAFNVEQKLLTQVQKPLRPRQWIVSVRAPDGSMLRGRLCAVRLPTEKAASARERLRREEGPSVTEEALAMAGFVTVFSTVDDEVLSCEELLELYRLRWQVELDFKRDKSITGLDKLPNFKPETIESWIYAKLLLHQLARKLSTPERALSPRSVGQACAPIAPFAAPCQDSGRAIDDARRAA